MPIKTIGILSPGDMGHAVGRSLRENNFEVITCLAGRSDRTRALSERAEIRDVPTLEALVVDADLILSILVPANALNVTHEVAKALASVGANTYFADCNAISPATAALMDESISDAGGRFIDASIIGRPPGHGRMPRFYTSGPHATAMSELDGRGIDGRQLGDEVGRASAIKMCYASMTKGIYALHIALLTTAQSLGLFDELTDEFRYSQPDAIESMENHLPRLPANAARWIGELEEIAETFEAARVTGQFHRGAAEVLRLLSRTPFADETPETIDPDRTLADTIKVLANNVPMD